MTAAHRARSRLLEPDGDARLVEEVMAGQLGGDVVLDVLTAADWTALLLPDSSVIFKNEGFWKTVDTLLTGRRIGHLHVHCERL